MTTRSGWNSQTRDSLDAIVRASLEIVGGPVPAHFIREMTLPSAAPADASSLLARSHCDPMFGAAGCRRRRPLARLTRAAHLDAGPRGVVRYDIPAST